jgi:hypothetical protein
MTSVRCSFRMRLIQAKNLLQALSMSAMNAFPILCFLMIPGGLKFTEAKRWVCGEKAPDIDTLNRTIPACLRIKPLPNDVNSKTPPQPARSLCLASPTTAESPKWCYNDPKYSPSTYHLYWSPDDKCGKAWRMFSSVDLDQSFYKLLADEKPADLGDLLSWNNTRNSSDISPTISRWLEWDDVWKAWATTLVSIEPCHQESD